MHQSLRHHWVASVHQAKQHQHHSQGKHLVQQQPSQQLPVLDSVLDYEKLHRIGEGTYGVVYKGMALTGMRSIQQLPVATSQVACCQGTQLDCCDCVAWCLQHATSPPARSSP